MDIIIDLIDCFVELICELVWIYLNLLEGFCWVCDIYVKIKSFDDVELYLMCG